MPDSPADRAYIAVLWEHPDLCIALFGVQLLTDEGRRLYEESGINDEIVAALERARGEGLLLNRPLMSPEGPILFQYWRSYTELDQWARKQPHSRWWRWLMEHAGQGVGFYHEIYQAKSAEAIYEEGTRPVGPALFSATEPVKGGEGRSRERQRRFMEGGGPSPSNEVNRHG
jgi:Domain of unknown function (DUF4188)